MEKFKLNDSLEKAELEDFVEENLEEPTLGDQIERVFKSETARGVNRKNIRTPNLDDYDSGSYDKK